MNNFYNSTSISCTQVPLENIFDEIKQELVISSIFFDLIAGVISDHLTLGRVLMERSSWGGQALKMQLHDKAPRRFFRWCALTCDHNWPSGSKAKKWIPEFFPIFISPGGIINFHAMNLCPKVSIAELVEWPEAFSGARFCNIWHRIRD